MNIKTPERVPLGILENLGVNCSSSQMNDSDVIDMTAGDKNTLTTPGNSVLANKENIPPFQTELLHTLNTGKTPSTQQKTCQDRTTTNRNYYQRSKEKNRVLMHNDPSNQTSTSRTGATHISSRLTFESHNGNTTLVAIIIFKPFTKVYK